MRALEAIARLDRNASSAPRRHPRRTAAVPLDRSGYLRAVDEARSPTGGERGRRPGAAGAPGDYLFPGAPVAEFVPGRDDASPAPHRGRLLPRLPPGGDAGSRIRQCAAGGDRAAAPLARHQRPFTAIAVLDRLGGRALRTRPTPPARPTVERDGASFGNRRMPDYAGSATPCST
jgi:hypothetical protein